MFNHFARHEQAFADWRRDGYPGVKAETYQYIDFLSDPADDQAPREGTLWPHQWEAFLRVIYSHEILGKTEIGEKGLLLNIVTGGGKTAAIAALIAWLRVAHGVQKFVRDREGAGADGDAAYVACSADGPSPTLRFAKG